MSDILYDIFAYKKVKVAENFSIVLVLVLNHLEMKFVQFENFLISEDN